MLQLKSFQSWHWRNRFCEHPVVVADIDYGEASTSYVNPVARAALRARFPLVAAEGQSSAALLASICLSLQREKFEAAPEVFGVERSQIWFAALDPLYAGVTLGAGAAFLNQVAERARLTAADAERQVGRLVESCEFAAQDQSTRAVAAEAMRRGIPWFRMALGISDIQLGHGFKQGRMCESMPSVESPHGIAYARNKALTYGMLSAAGLPVGQVGTATTPAEAVSFASAMGFPVVLKVIDGGQGVGVVVGLTSPEAVRQTAESLLRTSKQIIVQSFLPGEDHRLLVVAGRLIAAARREPAAITGDGARSIGQLVAAANQDPRRDVGYRKLMNFIAIDDETRRVLATQGLDLDSVPAAGRKVLLRLTANIHTGGTAIDVTDSMHPDNVWLAERAAAVIGLTVAGVDLIIPDISRSWREVGGGVCEVNSTVGLRPHWLADPTRDVEGPILETLFPDRDDGRIPTALVTGANGKTTTTRMLDHILRAAGHVVGSATTDAVTINGRLVVEGDYAGPGGAAMVLNDPAVTAAVLETARGGI